VPSSVHSAFQIGLEVGRYAIPPLFHGQRETMRHHFLSEKHRTGDVAEPILITMHVMRCHVKGDFQLVYRLDLMGAHSASPDSLTGWEGTLIQGIRDIKSQGQGTK